MKNKKSVTKKVETEKKKLRPHKEKSLYDPENRKGLTEQSKLRDMPKATIGEDNEGFNLSLEVLDMPRFGVLDLDLFVYGLTRTSEFGASNTKQSMAERVKKSNAAIAFIGEIEPNDTVEFLLASQMFAIHDLSMTMAWRAALPGQTPEGIDSNINRLTKLSRTFTTQIEALNKYRTKGQQKITVQHVNVETGGQAIVGHVTQGGGND
jgi:hypothetical protein